MGEPRVRPTVCDKVTPSDDPDSLFERVLGAPEWFDAVLDVVTDEATIAEAMRRASEPDFLAALETIRSTCDEDGVRLWVLLRLVDGLDVGDGEGVQEGVRDALARIARLRHRKPGLGVREKR